jgi:S1-C subfamily serine protease
LLSREQLGKLAETLQGIPVWGCLPGSQGQNAGVRYGDVVLSVNGQRTSDAAAYLAARRLRRDGMSLVVFREGTTHTLDLHFEQTAEATAEEKMRSLALLLIQARILPEDGSPTPGRDSDPS